VRLVFLSTSSKRGVALPRQDSGQQKAPKEDIQDHMRRWLV